LISNRSFRIGLFILLVLGIIYQKLVNSSPTSKQNESVR